MKHAGNRALDTLEPMLERLRACPGLTEKKRGIFYTGSRAVLHFHQDPGGLFADLRVASAWRRFPVNAPSERSALIRQAGRVGHRPASAKGARRPQGEEKR